LCEFIYVEPPRLEPQKRNKTNIIATIRNGTQIGIFNMEVTIISVMSMPMITFQKFDISISLTTEDRIVNHKLITNRKLAILLLEKSRGVVWKSNLE